MTTSTTFSFNELLDPTWRGRRANGGGNPYGYIPEQKGVYKVYLRTEDVQGKTTDSLISKITNNTIVNPEDKQIVLPKPINERKKLIEILEETRKKADDLEDGDIGYVIYIGKAENLRKRIKQYMRTVFGGKNHKGGINIWAIQDYANLLYLKIYPISGEQTAAEKEAEGKEAEEINKFKNDHDGCFPMANRINGKHVK